MRDGSAFEQTRCDEVRTTNSRNIVIFCGNGAPPSTAEAVEAIADAHPDWRILIVQGAGRRKRAWPYVKGKVRRLRREPVSYPLELLCKFMGKIHLARRHHVGGNVVLPQLCDFDRRNVSYYTADCIHEEEVLKAVREFRPWLAISLGAPILKPCLFQIPELGTINVHKSYLPDYRGMPPGFWELYDGTDGTGVSIHWVAKGLDTGEIVEQVHVAIPPYTMPGGIGPQLDEAAIPLLLSVLTQLDSGKLPRVAQGQPETPTRSRPPSILSHRVRRRLASKRSPILGLHGWVRRLAKACLQAAYVHLWARIRNLYRRFRGTAHVTFLLYHRVDDSYLDDVTVGIDQFRNQVRLLRDHYDVLDMEEFLGAAHRARKRPAVVITFDDGYESAHLAARLLRRERLPATFFICTRIVGSDAAFPHDTQKLGRRVPALSWDQIQEISRWGFHIGVHTASHANIAKIPFEEAKVEIETAINDAIDRLGHKGPETWFAYPHGKRDDITPEVRAALPELGVRYCFSAYGGINAPHFDALDIRRQGVDWKYSLLALRAVAEGWRVR